MQPLTAQAGGTYMQKTFIKYTFVIMTAAVFLILSINTLYTLHSLKSQQLNAFRAKMEQVIHILENNQSELEIMNKNLDLDYLTRVRAAAYIFDRQEEVAKNVSEMQYLAKLLNVDELHIIDENGIIVSASVAAYVGMDMADHKQTREFLQILESDDEDAYLIQEMQPNAAIGKMMKYVGIARKGQKGIVQVGFEPVRQIEARSRNTCEYIFSRFPTDEGEEIFAIDTVTGEIAGHSGGMEQEFDAPCYQLQEVEECAQGEYKEGKDGEIMFVASRTYEGMLLCAALPGSVLFRKLMESMFNTLAYLILIEAVVIFLLNYLVKDKVVNGIHAIIGGLSVITNGNLDTTVEVGGNQEFEKLSQGINTMVKSIINSSDRISAIIEISGVPLAAFEYEKEINHVFVTSGLRELLDIPAQSAGELYGNSALFERYIHNITEHPLEGEKNVFQINSLKYIRIHRKESEQRCLGVVTDVTGYIMEKKQMQYENTHDALTGLYKYSYFKQRAAEILEKMQEGEICAVVMLDLDYFKGINDNFGHAAGDKYLQSFASVMQSMPSRHVMPSRRSGDEFCMMIFGCQDKEEIVKLLNSFYHILKRYRVTMSAGKSLTIGASAVFACTADPNLNVEELLNRADEALYEVKRDTKGCYTEYKGSGT